MTGNLISESLAEFLAWYLAPWRRIPRWEFGVALTVVTLPGILFSLIGFGSTVGGFLSPLMGLFSTGASLHQAVGNGDVGALSQSLGGLSSLFAFSSSPDPAAPFDWSTLINAAMLLALIPICRMRLRDMGYWERPEVTLTVLFNASAVNNFLTALAGWDLLPMAWAFGLCNFIGYAWLCIAPTKTRARQTPPPPESPLS